VIDPTAPNLLRLNLEIALDRVADGVVFVDAAARVLYLNRQAREFFSSRRCRATRGEELAFTHPRTQNAFRRALHLSNAEAHEEATRPREFLVLGGSHSIIARAAVETLRRTSTAEPSTFLVALHPQPQDARVSAESLATLYGLSRGEARVASQVVAASSIADLAARLTLSRNTIKTHLRHIFRKCEVASLAQLTALVATGPGVR
jgi:ATP/maltotriose-dependent transcriptional regulator MalT